MQAVVAENKGLLQCPAGIGACRGALGRSLCMRSCPKHSTLIAILLLHAYMHMCCIHTRAPGQTGTRAHAHIHRSSSHGLAMGIKRRSSLLLTPFNNKIMMHQLEAVVAMVRNMRQVSSQAIMTPTFELKTTEQSNQTTTMLSYLRTLWLSAPTVLSHAASGLASTGVPRFRLTLHAEASSPALSSALPCFFRLHS